MAIGADILEKVKRAHKTAILVNLIADYIGG